MGVVTGKGCRDVSRGVESPLMGEQWPGEMEGDTLLLMLAVLAQI